ncbi:hypothetical protein [Isoptericola sp. G70]|uniref:hypothetical protein n=1 Tax=Isoptericola sp. G70 TaxID=3376633 RepID=UPI003A804B16
MCRSAAEPRARRNVVSSIALAAVLALGLSGCTDLEESAADALPESGAEATESTTSDGEAPGSSAEEGDSERASDEAADANADDGMKIKAGKVHWFNTERAHGSIDDLTPIEAEAYISTGHCAANHIGHIWGPSQPLGGVCPHECRDPSLG